MPEHRSFAALLRDVRDAWRLVALTVLVCVLIALVATLAQPQRYQGQGSVVVSPARFLDPSGTDALPALTTTVVALASREAVLAPTGTAYVKAAPDAATRSRRAREATLPWLRANTRARAVGTSSVIEMFATASGASDARDLARAFVSSLTTFVRDARTGDTPPPGGPVGVGLVVLDPGELVGKISPTLARNVFLGINAGLFLGLALAIGSRRRRRGAAQAAAALGVPSLGIVRPGTPGASGGLSAAHNLLEALSVPSGRLTVLVTGTSTADRIAAVAESLVRSLDRSGNRAVLVDGDGERRAVSRRFGAGERAGLLDAVADEADPGPLIVTTHPSEATADPPLHLLPAGTSGAKLDARELRALAEGLQLRFNLVVISGPALPDGHDLAELVSGADCWLLVADGSLNARDLGNARALMERSGTPMMGTLGVEGAARGPSQMVAS